MKPTTRKSTLKAQSVIQTHSPEIPAETKPQYSPSLKGVPGDLCNLFI